MPRKRSSTNVLDSENEVDKSVDLSDEEERDDQNKLMSSMSTGAKNLMSKLKLGMKKKV